MSQSQLEGRYLKKLREANLTAGCYRETRFHPERNWRIDFTWPRRKLGVEVDGGTWSTGRHNRGMGFEQDAVKFAEAAILGWRIIHVTGAMIRDGRAIELTRRLLESAEVPAHSQS